jgi:hypothetical protein
MSLLNDYRLNCGLPERLLLLSVGLQRLLPSLPDLLGHGLERPGLLEHGSLLSHLRSLLSVVKNLIGLSSEIRLLLSRYPELLLLLLLLEGLLKRRESVELSQGSARE